MTSSPVWHCLNCNQFIKPTFNIIIYNTSVEKILFVSEPRKVLMRKKHQFHAVNTKITIFILQLDKLPKKMCYRCK